VAARALAPDVAAQVDLMLATDTPDMQARGDVGLGIGPAMSLYSFHGGGTLNGTIPHPALVALLEESARSEGLTLQRSARVGVLTDSSYVQLAHHGVAAIDLGFPCRYTRADPRRYSRAPDAPLAQKDRQTGQSCEAGDCPGHAAPG
jgi:putative aminopeptidase